MTLSPGDVGVVGDILAENARRFPHREAVVDGDRRLTWSELRDRVNRLANALTAGFGLEPGDRVTAIADNCLEYYEIFHATAACGLVAAPLNQRLAAAELAEIVDRVEPRVILNSPAHADLARELAGRCDAKLVALVGEGEGSYNDLLSNADGSPPAASLDPRFPATICFTGGTTGLPKGVVIPHRSLAACGPRAVLYQGLKGFDRHLFVRPMAVAPGHRMVAQHGFSGGTTIIAPRFEPEVFARLTEAEQATTSLLSPTMFQMLLDSDLSGHDLSSLRTFAYGGAPSSPDLIARVLERFPHVGLHHVYGGTEAAVALHLGPDEHRADLLDSVGRAVPGVDVDLIDGNGAPVASGAPGELVVRSDELFSEYWRDPEATAEVLHSGSYRTGDLATRDPDGFVRIVGRIKDVVITGGFNVYPIEVENVLAAHPAVSEAAVIGVADRRWGEAVHAVVVPLAGVEVTEAELIDFCGDRIASYKKPKSVRLAVELPRTAVGKIDKQALRRAWSVS